MSEKIFLDNASTTKIDAQVNTLIAKTNSEDFYNPSAMYHESVLIKEKIEQAQKTIAKYLNVNPSNIIFTSGATEANNLAILGSYTSKKNAEYIFSSGEHPSVYNVAKFLEQKGCVVKYVKLTPSGVVDIEDLKAKLSPNTHFVSIMYVSNETGAINDLASISQIIKTYNSKIIFHVDGVQAFGKLDCNLTRLNIDAFSISAHKFHGPKGVGVLYYKNLNTLKPQILGGGQQLNYRSGTENVSGILGMALACELAYENLQINHQKVQSFRDLFIKQVEADLNDVDYQINQNSLNSPYVLSISFKGLKSEVLMHMLEDEGVLVGTGSACSSKKQENRVLQSMGKNPDYIKGDIRISFSRMNTLEEVEKASKIFTKVVKKLKNNILG